MSSTTDYLRNKFMKDGDDGIEMAENIIYAFGGDIHTAGPGLITIPDHPLINDKNYPEFWDAVQFLCEEWDYAIL